MDEEARKAIERLMSMLKALSGDGITKDDLFEMALSMHSNEDYRETKDNHEASHSYLGQNAKRLKLNDPTGLISDSEGEVTYFGDLFLGVICTMASMFDSVVAQKGYGLGFAISEDGPKNIEMTDMYVIDEDDFRSFITDLATQMVRLGIAYEKGDLNDYIEARQKLIPQGLQSWVVADDNSGSDQN